MTTTGLNEEQLLNGRNEEQVNQQLKHILDNINKTDFNLIVKYPDFAMRGIRFSFREDKELFFKVLKKSTLMIKLIILERFKELQHYENLLMDFLEQDNIDFLKNTFRRSNIMMPKYNQNKDEYLDTIMKRFISFKQIRNFILYYLHQNVEGDDINNYTNDPLLLY
jgi:hypothetical protein